MMEFHAVAEGACWAAVAAESPIRLEAGDVVVFSAGRQPRHVERAGLCVRRRQLTTFARRPDGEAVLERMSEVLFVEVLRRYVDALPAERTGWLAGIRDPGVGRALSRLHQEPARAWTLEQLASPRRDVAVVAARALRPLHGFSRPSTT